MAKRSDIQKMVDHVIQYSLQEHDGEFLVDRGELNEDLGDAGVELLARALESGKLPGLTELNLAEQQIGDVGAESLARAIQTGKLSKLTELDLGDNQIGDAGAESLARAIESGKLPKLSELYLAGNQIGDAGAESLARAIEAESLPNLRDVYLGGNHLDIDQSVLDSLNPEMIASAILAAGDSGSVIVNACP